MAIVDICSLTNLKKNKTMIRRFFSKMKRLAYFYSHPFLWGKHVQINGIPTIGNPNKLSLGKHVSLNDRCYVQSVGG